MTDSENPKKSLLEYYQERRKDIPEGSILLIKIGYFYEVLADDAEDAGRILDLPVSWRWSGAGPRPAERTRSCGIPYHAINSARKTLLEKYTMVVIDQQGQTEEGS